MFDYQLSTVVRNYTEKGTPLLSYWIQALTVASLGETIWQNRRNDWTKPKHTRNYRSTNSLFQTIIDKTCSIRDLQFGLFLVYVFYRYYKDEHRVAYFTKKGIVAIWLGDKLKG